MGAQDRADRGRGGGGQVGAASGDLQPAVLVGAAQEWDAGCGGWADDAGDDGFAGEPGPEFLPAAYPGPVGLVGPLGDDALDPGGGVPGQPGVGDGGVGGGGGEHHPRRQPRAQQLLQRVPAGPVGAFAQVGAAMGEQVEHHVGGRCCCGEFADPGRAGTQPVLQRGKVQPAGPPHHQFPVQHHAALG